jgi:uncharacterized protein with PQ loop repeat
MIELLGIIGTLLLAIGGMPQLAKTIRDGHADGLSAGMIWCWTLGFVVLLVYTFAAHPKDWILLLNYGFNLCVTLVFLRYKYRNKAI